MTFTFTALGSSAAIPVKERHLSAHLLNADERFLLFDCGEGTQFQLRRYHISFRRIKSIFISHLHGDHFFGLIGLLNSMHLLGRDEPVDLWAPDQLEEILRVQLEASMTTLLYPLNFHALPEIASLIIDHPKYTVSSFPVKHRIPSYGFTVREKKPPRKIQRARSFAYCGDTAYDETLIPHVREVSMLYHEATFMNDMAHAAEAKFHSTAAQAATIASKARVGQLILGHFSARYDDPSQLIQEAREIFPNTLPAEEGKIVMIE
jgi:ribonuclease Z